MCFINIKGMEERKGWGCPLEKGVKWRHLVGSGDRKNQMVEPGVLAHTCNHNTVEFEAGGLQI
jgi:hypothetical protein